MIPSDMVERARSTPIERIIDQHGIKLRGRIERVGPCPVCGGTDRFAINVRKQLWHCRGCSKGGDAIALVQHIDGVDFRNAIETLNGKTDYGSVRNYDSVVRAYPQFSRRRENPGTGQLLSRRRDKVRDADDYMLHRASRIWHQTVPIIGTPGEAYLAGRGIDLDDVPDGGDLRWHPACPWEHATTPCVLARFTDAITGEPRGIWRRPVNGGKPKTFGPMGGCVIRLWPDEDITETLVVGEGVETVLAAATRITHQGSLLRPAWAIGCAGNLEKLPVIDRIKRLVVLVDNDESGRGQSAAEACTARWRAASKEVIRLMPSGVGQDFNDVIHEKNQN